MADRLARLSAHPLGARLVRALGLPAPVPLRRSPDGWSTRPFAGRRASLGGAGIASPALRDILDEGGAARAGEGAQADILVFDATDCAAPEHLDAVYAFFHARLPLLARNGRVLVVAPQCGGDAAPTAWATARALEGFVRALGKEVGRRGAVANLLHMPPDALDRLDTPVRFLCGTQSAYVGGQVATLSALVTAPPALPVERMLAGRVALVTGAARGIGAAITARLAQEGARVIALDVPSATDALGATCRAAGAEPMTLDLTAVNAADTVAARLLGAADGVDIVVHNAGITRDRTLARMTAAEWDAVLAVNLRAVLALDAALIGGGALRDFGRLVYLSSVGGIAGNPGQTNYATTKAALIGYVAGIAPLLARRGICANAAAPGFIETAMTDRMPFVPRTVGRRLNALAQGGRPRDVAELVAFLCAPGCHGLTGQTIRVCGQALIGA